MSHGRECPRRYVRGVVVDPRIAALFERELDLRGLRNRTRGADHELDETLTALHWASTAWNASRQRSEPAVSDETVRPSSGLTTHAVASRLGVTPRRVQQLIAAGRIQAEKRDDRWFIPSTAVDDYLKAR